MIYQQFINKDTLCFDIGANRGNKTQLMLEFGAKVIAVEPLKECQDILREKFSNNENFTLISQGVGDKEGEVSIRVASDNTISSCSSLFIERTKKKRFKNYTWGEEEIISLTTLDNLMEQYGIPHFCKVDVEGFEPQVFWGLKKAIPIVSFEFTPEIFHNAFYCIGQLLSLNSAYRFNFVVGESQVFYWEEWVDDYTLIIELLRFVHNDRDLKFFGDIYARI